VNSFVGWAFKTAREKKKMPENRLLQISDLIDWAPIRKLLDEMYKNKTERGDGLTATLLSCSRFSYFSNGTA